jgi:hypothetical protein
MNTTWKVLAGVIIIATIVAGGWFYYFYTTNIAAPTSPTTSLPSSPDRPSDTPVTTPISDGGETTPIPAQNGQKVFKIADGPITGAAFVQTFHPTTTVARYVLGENGHVMDLTVENSGEVPHPISNTTIPGTIRALWSEGNSGVILQYLENGIVKSLHVGFPTSDATSTKTQAVRVQYFPDNIRDIAVSPDTKSITYLLAAANGTDGYTMHVDGTSGKKLFSAPLSELLVAWPAPATLLLTTKSSTGVPGAIFSVNTVSGAVVPLVYAPGVSAIADRSFARIMYQTISSSVASYVHDVKTGKNAALSFNPIPEKCIWSATNAIILYCAAPKVPVEASYLESWHQGTVSTPDAIFAFNVSTSKSQIIAVPGGAMVVSTLT